MAAERLCALADLPEGAVKVFEIGEFRLAAARAGQSVFVVEDRCSHHHGGEDRPAFGDFTVALPQAAGLLDGATLERQLARIASGCTVLIAQAPSCGSGSALACPLAAPAAHSKCTVKP